MVRAGIIGTGFAARKRAEAIGRDPRSCLVAIAGSQDANREQIAAVHGARSFVRAEDLLESADLDLIIIAGANNTHAQFALRALETGRHVVVEYPIALRLADGRKLRDIAARQKRLLHVEHIELLTGMHRTMVGKLPEMGPIHSAKYTTIQTQNPAPHKWTYHRECFGFPLVGALSRIHRLTHLFGTVQEVSCECRFWPSGDTGYDRAVLCQAHLHFVNGAMADVTYGKGEVFHHPSRRWEVHGEWASIVFEGEQGVWIQDGVETPFPATPREGLFQEDTRQVLDFLTEGKPLYVHLDSSLYAMEVAEAAERASAEGTVIRLTQSLIQPEKSAR